MSKRISKMLFSKERVELGLVDDLQSILNVFEKKLNPSFRELSKEKSKLRDLGEQAEKLLNKEEQNIAQSLKQIEKAANDLGVDVKSINDYQRVKALEKIIPDMRIVFKSVQ